mgnify:CR=1 FL=1
MSGFTGEQFALPEALDALHRAKRKPRDGTRVRVCGSDPLNLVGILTPGARVPSLRTRDVVYVDGLPVELAEKESARIAESTPKDADARRLKAASARKAEPRGRRRGRRDSGASGSSTASDPPTPGQLELR